MAADTSAVVCPTCGSTRWVMVLMVEVEVRWDSAVTDGTAVSHVRVLRQPGDDGHRWIMPIPGEYDARCSGCGELLLDWNAHQDDDEAWDRHYTQRRPAWNEMNERVSDAWLPEPNTWEAP